MVEDGYLQLMHEKTGDITQNIKCPEDDDGGAFIQQELLDDKEVREFLVTI